MKASDFYTLPSSLSAFMSFFPSDAAPWEWLPKIGPALASWKFEARGPSPVIPPGVHIEGPVYLHPTVKLPPYCFISGPAWFGPETTIRPGALVRANVIVGARSVVGSSCEYKNCLLMDDVQTAHFNYVGDSILGNRAHLGAGAILSNLRFDQQPVVVRGPDRNWETGLRKFGAILGEQAEVGCNAVLNPGSVLGKRALVAPTVSFGGVLPAATIARSRSTIALIPRKD